jgi:hypothetical protein
LAKRSKTKWTPSDDGELSDVEQDCSDEEDGSDVVRLLVKHGADAQGNTEIGWTVLGISLHMKIMRLLCYFYSRGGCVFTSIGSVTIFVAKLPALN